YAVYTILAFYQPCKQNLAVTTPCSGTHCSDGITDCYRHAAAQIHTAQGTVEDDEANGPAIGRPKWLACIFRCRQECCHATIQSSKPETGLPVHRSGVGNRLAIGRNRQVAREAGPTENEPAARRRIDLDAEHTLVCGRLTKMRKRPTYEYAE